MFISAKIRVKKATLLHTLSQKVKLAQTYNNKNAVYCL